MNNRGQFTIIAALLVAIVLAGTLIAVYATIRYDSSQSQTPQTLTATDETNSALLKALGFTVGYYGSILQVTGNQTYAYDKSTIYMDSALQYIASINPSFGESINMTSLTLSTTWFSNPSISTGTLSVVYDLADLSIYGVNYTTSCSLGVQIFNSPRSNQVCLDVTQDLTEPLTSLGQKNFDFYFYNYTNSNWQLIKSSLAPTIFTNGTYLINVPSEITSSSYMVQVTDSRGITVEASSFDSYNLNFAFSAHSSSAPAVVELLQNGTMLWSGQDLLNTTQAQPIPPIPVSSLNLCQTGSTSDIPFQVEDWASGYQIPLGLTSNYTIFSNDQMVVFEVSPSISQLTLWWNGSDTAIQPSAAYTDKYFTGDNDGDGVLKNGNLTLQLNSSPFQVVSTVGSVTSTANFMRIDGNANPSFEGSGPSYIIEHGVVRDIVEDEAEWNNGPTNCPNVYTQIVITLPANATYFTYQLRLIFINGSQTRSITDISPLQLTTSLSSLKPTTENGINANGIPIVSTSNGYFYNNTGTHQWSELINDNNALQGTGIMFTASANQELYAFDKMANTFTGALYISNSTPSDIELDPVTSAGPVSFKTALDLTWYGSVATFNGANPIYATSGNSGLWPLVEQPPSVAITPVSSGAVSISITPSADPVGTKVVVSGGGFLPGSQITITYDGNNVAEITATAFGAIPSGTAFSIPASSLGPNTINAHDIGSNSASATFDVTLYPMETITLQPNGISNDIGSATILTIDSVPYSYSTLPITFNWEEGSTHTISASNPISVGTNKQYAWTSWSDGGTQTHTYTVPSSSATVTANYDAQYQVSFNYQVSGGGSGYSAPTITYYNLGSQVSVTAGPSATVWVDSGSTYSYTNNPLSGSGTSERWYASSSTSGTISSSSTIDPTYYNQYSVTFGYGDQDSSSITSGSQIGSYYQFGSALAIDSGSSYGVTSPVSGWVDAGSGTVSYQTFTSGGQSWALSSSPASFTVSSSGTISDSNYYHQYSLSVTATPGSAVGGTFQVTYKQFGTTNINQPQTTTWSSWADAGSTVTVSNPQSSFGGDTFSSYTNNPATMNAAQTITLQYLSPAPALDESATGNAVAGSTYLTVNFPATSSSGELIVIAVSETNGESVSSITPSAYNFQKYTTLTVDTNVVTEVWYGVSTAVSAQTITINFAGSTAHSTSAVVFSVSGADTASPFDGTYNTKTGTDTASGSISASTTRPNDLVIAALGLDASYNTPISATGSNTLIGYSDCGTGTGRDTGVESQTVATPSNTQESFSWTGGSYNWGIIELAIESSSAAWINLSPSSGPVGTSVTVSGGGFLHSSQITITFNGNTVDTTTSTASGTIPSGTTFNIPSSPVGSYTITVTDTGSNSAVATFTVTYPTETITFQASEVSSDAGSGTILTIDSVLYTYSMLPVSFTWQVGSTHTISASSIVTAGTSKQYVWTSWSDGGAQTHTYTVPSSSATVTAYYDAQYQVSFNYQVSGGGSGYSAPTITYYNLGSQVSVTAGPSATVWVDSGSTYSYTNNPLSGSGTSERWYASSSTSGTISSSSTIDPTYYNQYSVTFGYGDQDSSSITSGSQIGSYYQFGSALAIDSGSSYGVTSPVSGWVDAGSGTVSYQTFTSGGQSWALSSSPASFTVSSSGTISDSNYYHQYSLAVTATPSSAVGGTFQVTYKQFGTTNTNQQQTTTWNSWADAGSTVTVSNAQSLYDGDTFSSYTNNLASMNSAQTITLQYLGSSPKVDKYATGNAGVGATSMAISFPATTSSGELIVVAVTESTNDYVSSITPSGYNFQKYTTATVTVDTNVVTEVWYGVSTTASAQTITINFDKGGGTAHSTSAVVFSVSGADTASPFDSSPNTKPGTLATSASISTSTTKSNDLVIGVLGLDGGTTTAPTATGSNTLIAYSDCASSRDTAVEYQTVATPSNTQESFSWTNSYNWGIIEFAIESA